MSNPDSAVPAVSKEPTIHDRSVEYAVALAELQRLQPQYVAAVKRYNEARDALHGHINAADENLNII